MEIQSVKNTSASSAGDVNLEVALVAQPTRHPVVVLVADQAVPAGYEQDFAKLEPAMLRSSDSSVLKASRVDSLVASLWLHQYQEDE